MGADNQKNALHQLNDFGITYKIVDGMDEMNLKKRELLFEISGIRGNYPQIFLTESRGTSHIFLGGYDWLRNLSVHDLTRCLEGGATLSCMKAVAAVSYSM